MILLGVRAHDYGKDTPEHLFQRIHEDGFDSVQLAIKKAIIGVNRFDDIKPALLNRLKLSAKKQKIHIAVLGVYNEPALVDEMLRRKNLSVYIKSIPMAVELGADCIGTETTKMSLQPHTTRKDALNALLRSLECIMKIAEENQVTVAIEPVASHTVNTPQLAAYVLKNIQSPYLKVIFDPVNLLTIENFNKQDDLWEQFIQKLGDKIAAVHIKGVCINSKGKLMSCSFCDSDVDYKFIFSKLRKLPYDFSVLREEIDPKKAEMDLKFLQNLVNH